MSPRLVCGTCGLRLPRGSLRLQCSCGGLLEAHPAPSLRGVRLRAAFDRRREGDPAGEGSGVWRFRELLLPGRGPLVSHPEGNTNLYRRDASPESKKCSLLFGLFKYQSGPDGKRWRAFYVPFGKKPPAQPQTDGTETTNGHE